MDHRGVDRKAAPWFMSHGGSSNVEASAVAQTDPQLKVRLPREARDFVAREAARNGSSRNSEIIRAIRERMERVQGGMQIGETE